MNFLCAIVGILVSGGQAPGINSVISAVTIPFKQTVDITLQSHQIACQYVIRFEPVGSNVTGTQLKGCAI